MYMSSVGENLKSFRVKAGYTQHQVEAELRLRSLMLKDLETERLKLSAEMALKLAKLYKVSLDEMLANAEIETESTQSQHLSLLQSLFTKSEIEMVYLDPIIRAYLEDYQDKVIDHSVYELIIFDLTEKQKKEFTSEVLKTLSSLMGIDSKVTREELNFIQEMIKVFKLDERAKSISKTIYSKHLPSIDHFHGKPAAKHFLIWLLFFISRSDGQMTPEEFAFIEESAVALKISRSNFLYIKKFFVKEKY